MSDRFKRPATPFPYGFCLVLLCLMGPLSALAQTDTSEIDRSPAGATPRTPFSPLSDPFPYDAYRHQVEFDTASNQVRIYEQVFGQRIGQPTILTLDEFIAQRQRAQEQAMWEKRTTEYSLGEPPAAQKSELEKILGEGGEFKIPIPQNPIFSIFGAPTVSINVNAAVNVSAGWQWDNNNLTSISSLGSTQSAPFFNQNITVSASGKIGDKLKLSADFDNGRSFDFDNQLKIAFGGGPGSDDDIIQGIEAGNVQLQSPSTLIGGSQALFGVKSSFKFGPLFLTTIASQKRGEKKRVTVSGGSVKSQISIKPYEYAQNHFFLDLVYKDFYDEYFASTPPTTTLEMEPFNVLDLEVYEQVKDASIPGQFRAIAWADLDPLAPNTRYAESWRMIPTQPPPEAGTVQMGSFKKLELGTGYEYNRQLGTLTIRSLQQDKIYAVAYRIKRGESYGELSNTRDSSSIAVLKMVYMNSLQPNFRTLWARQMKNIYPLQGVRNVDLENSTIRITYGVPPDTSEVLRVSGSPRLVTVLGVDRYNSSNEAQPDGMFDIRSPYFFDPVRGEIIFPSTEPFRKGLRQSQLLGVNAEPYVLHAVYDDTREQARRDMNTSRFTIAGEISGAGGNKIQLPSWGLTPGSVSVTVNGEPLRENEDYRVDPVFGEVTLLSARALSTTGNVVVDYEQNDFFTTAVKTLLGVRADYDLFNKRYGKSRLGMTFLRYAQNTQTEKVQIYSGDEPTTNMMLGFDGMVDYRANFLTKAINALPLIDTKEPSTISLRGEWAMVMPNPNTKPSLVASDNEQGAAYVDDFESGAKRQIQLSTSYTYWRPASPPVDLSLGASDSARVAKKGHFFWYNRLPADTETREIWENRDVAQGAQKTTVLDLVFDPKARGMYNPNLGFEQGNVPPDSIWGGMMRSLSFYSTNLDEENIDYIEITMKVDEQLDPNAKMYIDLGQISEDVIPNIALNTEDGITPNNPQQDDILNDGEDIGIDGLADANEPGFPGDPDPSRDNYVSYRDVGDGNPAVYQNYHRVNGTEANVGRESGPFPDTEDLNGNRGLDLDNTYFNYEINLSRDALTNPQIVGGGDNRSGWRQYRIPIRTGFRAQGNPSFSNIQFARIWFKSGGLLRVRIAEVNLVGSDWRNLDAPNDSTRDPKLDIAFVSLVDNSGPPDFYTMPPGVRQEVEAGNDVLKNEQSLSIRVRDLERGESRGAIRIRPRAFDVFNYKEMKFFLYGGGDMDDAATPGAEPKVVAFMRFGWDSLNYYEYRVPLLRGWNEYTINFADLSAIKQDQTQLDASGRKSIAVPGQPGNRFMLRGIPSLTRIQFIAFGIENNAYPGALATTMWVNELRAVGAEDANDWAATVSAGVKLADLGNVNFNAKRVNPNFHQLEERFGRRIEETDWALNSVFQLEKFLPNSFKGSSIPLTFNHVERVERPRYVSESDVEVEAAVRQLLSRTDISPEVALQKADSLRTATQTVVVRDGFAFSNFRIAFPGENWVIRDILNRFTLGFNYDQTRQRSPLIQQRFAWNWDFQGRYAVDIPQNFDLQPFKALDGVPVLNFWKDFRVNFLPSQFSASTSVHRERTTEQLRNIPDPSPVNRDFRATRGAQFNWRMTEGGILNVTTDYTVDTRSSLTHLETDFLGRQRSSSEIASDIFFKEGRLFNFGLDNDLTQNITFNTRPRIPFIPDIDRFVTPTARYNVRYSWQDQLGTTNRPGGYTKSAQWNSTATLGLDVRLAALGNALFGEGTRGTTDSTGESALTSLLRYLVKIPLLDFQTVRLSYTQNNSSKNPGVVGSTGLSNLWGRSLLFRSESPDFGPGTAYQLGLTSDPHGKLVFGLQSAFPFISVGTRQGIRAPSIYVQDNYTQKNTLTATTNRPLWPGASLDLNWSVDWGYNKNYSVTSNANGVVTGYSGAILTGNLTRTYLSLPTFFGLNLFNNEIEDMVEEYRARVEDIPPPPAGGTEIDSIRIAYNKQLTELLSRTFEEQFESMNWLPGEISRYLPRLNWRFQWNGIEKIPFFTGWAQSVSFRHEYKSQFARNFTITDDEGMKPESHTISRGFQPLAQITVTGKPDVWKGTMTGSIAYKTQTNFSLVSSARSEVSQELKNELETQFSYQRRGLSLPLFGLNLKNDIEFTFAFSYARSNRKRFDLTNFTPQGNNDGSTRINIRPSVRYTLSNTVQASAFVSHEATIPDDEGSREIRRSTTKVGIDLRIGISGGR